MWLIWKLEALYGFQITFLIHFLHRWILVAITSLGLFDQQGTGVVLICELSSEQKLFGLEPKILVPSENKMSDPNENRDNTCIVSERGINLQKQNRAPSNPEGGSNVVKPKWFCQSKRSIKVLYERLEKLWSS